MRYGVEASQSQLFRVRESCFIFVECVIAALTNNSTFSGCLLESLFLFCRAFPQDANPLPLLT